MEETDWLNRLNSFVSNHPVGTYFLVTLVVSWAWWSFAYLVLAAGPLTRGLIIPGGFGPLIAAVAIIWVSGESPRLWLRPLLRWRLPLRWYVVALILPVIVVLGSTAIYVIMGIPIELAVLMDRAPMYPLGLLLVMVIGGGQEEFGWRGFALPRLQTNFSALTASCVIGLVWAIWHLPLYFMGAARSMSGSFPLYVILAIAVSIILTSVFNSSAGSVLPAMLVHAGINASGALQPLTEDVMVSNPFVLDAGMVLVLSSLALVVVWRHGKSTLAPIEEDAYRHSLPA